MKNTHIIQHSCVNVRPADVSSRVFLPPSLARNSFFPLLFFFSKRVTVFKSLHVHEKMVWARVRHHTVFKRSHKSTMIHWQTWDFSSTQTKSNVLLHALCFLPLFALLFMAVSLKTLKVGALPVLLVHIYTELYITHPSPWNARRRSIRFPHDPQPLHPSPPHPKKKPGQALSRPLSLDAR